MKGFATAISEFQQHRLRGKTSRLISLVVTVLVHTLGVIIVVYNQSPVSPDHASRPADRVFLVSRTPNHPNEPKHEPEPEPATPASVAKTKPIAIAEIPVEIAAPAMSKVVADTQAKLSRPSLEARATSDVIQDYRRELFERLAAQRHYPDAALLKHYQGDGAVLFRIDRDGNLLHAAIERSTGRALLDHAAIMQVRRSAPFPKIPPELPDELAVAMPLQFLIVQPGTRMAAR
ncbi:energy transducer TonB [Novosphingobium sp. P6W]|uniref:energy transducer TonB n=1 Tax=Novosphingobium sp. P6W TaxID=1609758 RepID=UPI000AF62579|nr:TonB family protein [Novosphingobium sp. P6W]